MNPSKSKYGIIQVEIYYCSQKVVFSESDEFVDFSQGMHAGRHLVDGAIEELDVNAHQLFTPVEYVEK